MEDFLLRKISELRQAKDSSNIAKLKELGSSFAEEAFVRNDARLVEFSIIAYSIAKFMEKPYIVGTPKWRDFREDVDDDLAAIMDLLRKDPNANYLPDTGAMLHKINDLSATMGRFISSLADKARIKAAAQMYAHGASLGTAAKLAGADKRELSKYLGTTRIPEKYATIPVRARLDGLEKAIA